MVARARKAVVIRWREDVLAREVTTRAAIAASMAATPQHVLASAFGSHLIDFDAAAAAAACKLPIAYIGAVVPMANLSKFREFCPHLKVGQTFGSGHCPTAPSLSLAANRTGQFGTLRTEVTLSLRSRLARNRLRVQRAG